MKKIFFISIICLTVLGRTESKKNSPSPNCSYEPSKEQSIVCTCKGKLCDGSKITEPHRNFSHGDKPASYCGVKTTAEATEHCQKHCNKGVKHTQVFEHKKTASE